MEIASIYATKAPYSVAVFLPAQVDAYRKMRLEALREEPGMFGNSLAYESAYDDKVWEDRVRQPLGACFGLYHNQDLIGITGITGVGQKEGEAYMTQSYIRKAHRGKRLSRLLYEARLAWARERNLKRLLIGHKQSNLVSKAANQHFGFTYTHSEPRTWPDGSKEDMLCYELWLERDSEGY